MKGLLDRRQVLTAAASVIAGASGAQAADIDVIIQHEGDAVIPAGTIELQVQGAAAPHAAATRLLSDGKSRLIQLSLADAAASPPRQIVARLLRDDGWLLARGMAVVRPGAPVRIMLHTVMY